MSKCINDSFPIYIELEVCTDMKIEVDDGNMQHYHNGNTQGLMTKHNREHKRREGPRSSEHLLSADMSLR